MGVLNQRALVTTYGDTDMWVNIGSGNGLLPNGTKPFPEPMVIYQYGYGPFTRR